MNIMIITEDQNQINSYKPMIAEYAQLYTITNEVDVTNFLERKDKARFDLIFIVETDKKKAVEQVKAELPHANIILINSDREVVNHADVLQIVNTPITREEFRQICYQAEFSVENNPSENVVISCFKSLTFKNRINSKVPIEVKWRTMKAKELFTYLLLSNNHFQRKKVIQDMFWEDLDEKSVNQQLYSTVYEIRKTIEKNKIPVKIISLGDKYMLKTENVWIDYEVFEYQLKYIHEVTEENQALVKSILELYTDHLLETEDYDWIFGKREELRFFWTIHMERLRDFYIDKGYINEAIILNLKMTQFLPNNKLVKDNLNKLYSLIGEPGI